MSDGQREHERGEVPSCPDFTRWHGEVEAHGIVIDDLDEGEALWLGPGGDGEHNEGSADPARYWEEHSGR